jgi:hypothetical protein
MGESRKISLSVNGKRYENQEVEVRVTLADFIRHQLAHGTISAASMGAVPAPSC